MRNTWGMNDRYVAARDAGDFIEKMEKMSPAELEEIAAVMGYKEMGSFLGGLEGIDKAVKILSTDIGL